MKKVKIYTTSTCPYCFMAKDYLKEKGVEFEEVDLTEDPEEARKLIEKTGYSGVPQIQIGEEFVIGFDKDKIDQLLELD